jgi:hypothetical protein
MQRRHLAIALALVLAFAAVAPTFASPSQRLIAKSSFPVRTAKAAKRIAKTAKGLAQEALTAAGGAQATADQARQAAAQTEGTVDSTRIASDFDAATVTTAEEAGYVDLGGPSVAVQVPSSGLIEVWAQATIADGSVSLYEDGSQVDGQSPNNICPGPPGALLAAAGGPPFVAATPTAFSIAGCGADGPPGSVLFETTPGTHTYSLRYADCGCDPADAQFSDRTLRVAPRL